MNLLREAARSYISPLCLKDLSAKIGMSVPEASRASKILEVIGYATRHDLSIGRQHIVLLEPAEEGFKAVGLAKPAGAGLGGIGHRYGDSLVENFLRKKAYQTRRDPDIKGKSVDVVGEKAHSTVFVEVEMTSENAARNAVADLAVAGPEVKQIAVVCPTESVLRQVRMAVETAIGASDISRFAFKVFSDLKG